MYLFVIEETDHPHNEKKFVLSTGAFYSNSTLPAISIWE